MSCIRWGLILAVAATLIPRARATAGDNVFDYFGGLQFADDIPSPREALGYGVGERFTRHADMLAYLRQLAATSDRVQWQSYGRTHEGRELVILTISSPENLARLDEILARNRELMDSDGVAAERLQETIETNPAIVWFSHSVHGNEPSPAETALQTAYTMAAAQNEEIEHILKQTVLVIDPLLNPDGHERYVTWYQMVRGVHPISSPDAAEHDEPWPGGRTNHYYFDLNRDWIWLVQPESRQRLQIYRRYLPQLHIDHHEQGYRSPFFFGGGEDPYNNNIPPATRAWVERYGENNARAFDREGLVYATRERFDYLYPGYGKVLPVYYGAVGMLSEKGGHSRAGLAIDLSPDNVLTLQDRARDNFILGMSNLELTASLRQEQLERFHQFFRNHQAQQMYGPRFFVIPARNDPALRQKVWDLCQAHQIQVSTIAKTVTVPGLHDYRTGEERERVTLSAGSWILDTEQPMGRLVRVLWERVTEVFHTETYDITAWSLPVCFGLDAYFSHRALEIDTEPVTEWSPPAARATGQGNVALLVDARQHQFPRALGHAIRHRLFARITGEDVSIDGQSFVAGSLIVHGLRNRHADLKAFAGDVIDDGLNLHRTSHAMTDLGPVLGANAHPIWTTPKIALLRGEPMSSYSFGQHWHLLDVESPLPYTPIGVTQISQVLTGDYNVLVLADSSGNLNSALGGSDGVARLKKWVTAGGVIVATGSSARWAHRELLGINESTTPSTEKPDDRASYQKRRDQRAEARIPGSLFLADVDGTHPLSAGSRHWMGVLKRSARGLPASDGGYVVVRLANDPLLSGVASAENNEGLSGQPFMTDHRLGRGAILGFADDVTVRGFHHAGMRLLLNAILYGPTLSRL